MLGGRRAQEDNAGPHIDKTYKDWLQGEFDRRGWKLEPQAPQGPYTNVLDLQMFPAMSKRYSLTVSLTTTLTLTISPKAFRITAALFQQRS